jgi:hypothetical protein
MRKGLLCFLAIGVVAAQAADVAGHYYLQHFREVGSELLLRPDGNFDFMLAYGAADYWAKGTWRAENGYVLLNSAPGEEKPPFRLLRSSAANAAAIRIRVVAANGRAVPNIDVILATEKDKLKARTDSDGIALFPRRDPAKSAAFEVRVYHLETEPIELNPAHDDFTFEIDGQAITELRFTDERLTVIGKTLVMHYWGPDQEMNYVRE